MGKQCGQETTAAATSTHPWGHHESPVLPCRPFILIICEFRKKFKNSSERQEDKIEQKDCAGTLTCQQLGEITAFQTTVRKLMQDVLTVNIYLIMKTTWHKHLQCFLF